MKKISILLLLLLIVFNGCKNQAKLDFSLCKAIHKRDYQKVKNLLDQGADPNVKDTNGMVILCEAIVAYMPDEKKDRFKIVQLLLQRGANPNSISDLAYKNTTALMYAVTSKDNAVDIVKLLIEKGANINAQNEVGQTALIRAATRDFNLTKLLLKLNADKTISTDDGMNAFRAACYYSKYKIAKLLFNPKTDLNVKGNAELEFTALMLAALSSSPKIVEMLLKNGANLNIKDKRGKTALDIAIDKDHKKVIEIINKYKKFQQN